MCVSECVVVGGGRGGEVDERESEVRTAKETTTKREESGRPHRLQRQRQRETEIETERERRRRRQRRTLHQIRLRGVLAAQVQTRSTVEKAGAEAHLPA